MPPNVKKNISIISITLGSGGAEKVISLLLKKLPSDYNVHLVLFYNVLHFNVPENVKLVALSSSDSNSPFYLKLIHCIRFFFKYLKFIKRENISISISFLAFPNLINGMIGVLSKSTKIIISERGFPSDNVTSRTSFLISKIFYPILYNKCDRLFSNSVHINEDLEKNFGVKIPMNVIYNPIELLKIKVDSGNLSQEISCLKVVTAGSLIVRKNQSMIIKAIDLSHNDYSLSIYGGGNLKEELQKEIDEKKLNDKIQLKGVIKNINEKLVENHCFVLSSYTEGFPNSLLEGLACGLPAISTNCLSGPLELLNNNDPINIKDGDFFKGKYGLLVNNNDEVGLKKALDFYYENPAERKKYSELSLRRAKDYSLPIVYKEFKKFIER